MKERTTFGKIPVLALQQRRQGLARLLPSAEEILRGSLVERYVSCGNPDCRCARGQRHGPVWYLTVTLGAGRTAGWVVPTEQVDQVRRWIENYRRVKDDLEKISAINHELLRRSRSKKKKAKE